MFGDDLGSELEPVARKRVFVPPGEPSDGVASLPPLPTLPLPLPLPPPLPLPLLAHAPTPNPSLFETNSHSLGLAMMRRMGFKVGDALGLTSEGIRAPIEVAPVQGRAGLGAPQALAATDADFDLFRQRSAAALTQAHQEALYWRLAKLCCQLNDDDDADPELVNPLWRPYVLKQRQTFNQRQQASRIVPLAPPSPAPPADLDSINQLLVHLRSAHHYCAFCGCFYNDADDLATNCPGIHEADHLY